MSETVFHNARIVLADEVVTGSVRVAGGSIVSVDPGAPGRAGEDLEGDLLLPGLVELHTDHLECHYVPRPGVRWDATAALQAHDGQVATAGITTVFDALRVGADGDGRNLGAEMQTLAGAISSALAADRLRADHFIHLRCEISASEAAEDMRPFADNPHLRLVSLMDHTPGQRQFVNLDKYRLYFGGKIGLSGEKLDAFMADRLQAHHLHAGPNRRAIVEICRERGIVMASHDDATLAHVEEAIADGVAISEFPTTEAAATAARQAGLDVLMGAPNVVRGGSHSGNVSAADLAERGIVDLLSSDYVPASLLQAAFLLPERLDMGLAEAIALVTTNPARAVGLDDRGEIRPGLRADLVRVATPGGPPVVRSVWRQGRRVA